MPTESFSTGHAALTGALEPAEGTTSLSERLSKTQSAGVLPPAVRHTYGWRLGRMGEFLPRRRDRSRCRSRTKRRRCRDARHGRPPPPARIAQAERRCLSTVRTAANDAPLYSRNSEATIIDELSDGECRCQVAYGTLHCDGIDRPAKKANIRLPKLHRTSRPR